MNHDEPPPSNPHPMVFSAAPSLLSSVASKGAISGVTPWVALSAAAHVAIVTMVHSAPVSEPRAREVAIEFSTFDVPDPSPADPLPEPVVQPPPPRPRAETHEPPVSNTPEPARQAAVATEATAAVVTESVAEGLPIAAEVGHTAAPAMAAGHPEGDPNANGTGPAPVDPAPFRRAYTLSINRHIPKPEVPRSLQDSGFEGVTVIGLTLDPSGRVVRVRVARSSGEARFDALALEFYQSHAFELPAPPPESQWVTREIPLPIRWHG